MNARTPKISMAELQRLAGDPSVPEARLRKYFTSRPDMSRPFAPAVIPNPARVDVAHPQDQLEGAMLMDWGNGLSRLRRQREYEQRRESGDRRPVLVSEGDSWFQFPILLDDIIDQLAPDFTVWSTDAAGDTLQNMVIDHPEYPASLQTHADVAQAFLFSGAGNDILGADASGRSVLADIVRPYQAGKPASWYIQTPQFADKLKFVETCYRTMLSTVQKALPKLPVLCHGYDYIFPGGAPGDQRHPIYAARDQWIGRPMREDLGIRDPELQREIVRLMIDRLNALLAGLCGANRPGGAFRTAWHVDVRGKVGNISYWNDELHPTDQGFAHAAAQFRSVLKAALQQAAPRAAPPVAKAPDLETAQSFVCEAAGEAVEAAAGGKPQVNRVEQTDHKSGRDGADIDHIVIHYTTSRDIEGSIRHFKTGSPRTSAHYIVGRDGALVQMVEDEMRAWHAGDAAMNARSIGIEHVAAPGDEIAPAQARTSLALIRWLMQTYGIAFENIIPHVCVKATNCCGDLFKAYGGRGGLPCGPQLQALRKWLTANGVGAGTEAVAPAAPSPRFVAEAAGSSGRLEMAAVIINFEARRDAQGHLAVYKLPKDDGGGAYEVAGINERFHKQECDELVSLIQAGRYEDAETRAREFIAAFTDPAAAWCGNGGVEFYLRDCYFNRGPGGAARIVQKAVGAAVDGKVGAETRAAIARAEEDPEALLGQLRAAREWYEREYAHRDESSRFWKGLKNRWDNALKAARKFLGDGQNEAAPEFVSPPAGAAPLSSQMQARAKLSDDDTLPVGRGVDFIRPQGEAPFSDIGDDSPVADLQKMNSGWRAYRNGYTPEEDLELVVERDTSLPASFLQALADHRRAVGRVSASGVNFRDESGQWAGTGFLVGKNLLLTNHHVLNSPEVARDASVDFDYEVTAEELAAGGQEPSVPLGKRSFRFDPARLFLTSPATGGGLDYTFVWLDNDGPPAAAPIAMRRAQFSAAKNEQAFVIHHPQGHGKRVSLDDVDVVDFDTTVVHYVSDTMPGSSGSPVFDRQGRLFALHHAGRQGDFRRPDNRPVGAMNEGVKLAAIFLDLERRRTGPEKAMAETVLALVQGSDTLAGFFGSLGRDASKAKGASDVEAVVDAYRGSDADIDVGFWNIEWLANRYHDPVKLREAAAAIVDLGLDIWGLEEVSPPAVAALVGEIERNFGQTYAFALSEPDAPESKQSTAVIWNAKTVEGRKAEWPQEIEALWRLRSTDPLEAVEGKIFDRYPALYHFAQKGAQGFEFYLVPLHLKAMAEGAKRRRLASRLLARAIKLMTETYAKGSDWVLGGDFNAELASGDFRDLLSADMKPMSAYDEEAGAFSYIQSPHSLIDHIFLSANLVKRTDENGYFIVAKEKSVDNYARKLSDHRPVLVRLSIGGWTAPPPVSADIDAEIERLLRAGGAASG